MFVPLGPGQDFRLVRGMIVQSGNDACVVLAEGLAAARTAFVEQMNQKGKKSGSRTAISPMSTGCRTRITG